MEPLRLTQTRLHKGSLPHERGNCLPAVIACILHKQVEDVYQVQLDYDKEYWFEGLDEWLTKEGYELNSISGHILDGRYYFVSGVSPRNPRINHICIYNKGKLWHDPHPSGVGVVLTFWYAIRHWGLWILNPIIWMVIFFLALGWPIVIPILYITRNKDGGTGYWS